MHGFGDNHRTWNGLTQSPSLRDGRFHLVDLPGFGETPLPPDGAFHYSRRAVEEVGRAIAELPSGVRLGIAHSLGGAYLFAALAQAARAGRPGLDGVLLLAPATPWTREPPFLRFTHGNLARLARRAARHAPAAVRQHAARSIVRVALRLALAPGRRADPLWIEALTATLARPGTLGDWIAIARELERLLRGADPNLRDLFLQPTGLELPIWIARGELDRVIGARELKRLGDGLIRARLHALTGVGHCPQAEAIEPVAELVLQLLAQCTNGVSRDDEV